MSALSGGALALEHRYEVGAEARSRGALTVYEARQDPFGIEVRVHAYDLGQWPQGPEREAARERLRAFAQRAGRRRRAGWDAVLDHGELDEARAFLVTSRPDGVALDAALEQESALPIEQVRELARALCTALAQAHEDGIVHGAIEPAWVTLRRDDPARSTLTPLAPDASRSASEEDDVRACGALLYCCLTAEEAPEASASSEREARERLAQLAGDDPLARAIEEALWAEPAPSASALAASLALPPRSDSNKPRAPLTQERAQSSAPPPPEWDEEPDRRAAIAGIAILLLIVSNLGWLLYVSAVPSPRTAPAEKFEIEARRGIEASAP